MPKWPLHKSQAILETELCRTMQAAYDKPNGFSDLQYLARAIMQKFDTTLKAIPEPLKYECAECSGAGRFISHPEPNHYDEVKCAKCAGKGYFENLGR